MTVLDAPTHPNVPRQKPPKPGPLDLLDLDKVIELAAAWEEPQRARQLRAIAIRLGREYHEGWANQDRPGRPERTRRNALIISLAEAFQKHAGWDADHYRPNLMAFLVSALLAARADFPVTRLLRILPPHLRAPRAASRRSTKDDRARFHY